MKVSITAIDQRFSLEGGDVSNFIVIKLPSGHEIRVAVDPETLQLVAAESSGVSSHPKTEGAAVVDEEFQREFPDPDPWGMEDVRSSGGAPQPEHTPTEVPEQLQHHVEDGVVEWETLPDTQLPPQMKNIMRQSQINPIISIADLDQLKGQILEHLRKQPKDGKVRWNEGTQRQTQNRPRRTVPMDEAGNPKPPGGITEVDPGEGQDEDEDGVSQA